MNNFNNPFPIQYREDYNNSTNTNSINSMQNNNNNNNNNNQANQLIRDLQQPNQFGIQRIDRREELSFNRQNRAENSVEHLNDLSFQGNERENIIDRQRNRNNFERFSYVEEFRYEDGLGQNSLGQNNLGQSRNHFGSNKYSNKKRGKCSDCNIL